MGKTPRVQISIVESAVVVGILTGLATILMPAVDAARERQGLSSVFPLLAPFYRDRPLLFVFVTTSTSIALTIGLLAAIRSFSMRLARRIVWTKLKRDSAISPEIQARIAVVIGLLAFCSILLCCSGIVFYSRPEEVARLQLSDSFTARVFAEGSFHYEPPGYLSIEVLHNGKIVVPRYKFVGIGPERAPKSPLTVITSDDGTVVAIVQNNDIQFMIDLTSGECWPPRNWNGVQFAPDLADRLFGSLGSHPNLTFSRLESLKRCAESRKSRK